jgi:hypothetical protein
MAFAVLRCQKVKANDVSKVHNHNLRKYENHSAENINFDRNQNQIVLGSADTHKKLKENLEILNSKKALRKDANVLLEFVFSASPEFFYNDLDKNRFEQLTMKDNKSELDKIFNEKLNKENLDKFKNAVVDFINSKPEFKNNVVNLVLHLDEKTPHFHLALTPILNNRLTAKEFFTPDKARFWQDDFHKHCQKNNIVLERGKEFSPAVHQTLNAYRSNEPVDMPEPPQDLNPPKVDITAIGSKILLTDKVLTTKTELVEVAKQQQAREQIQGKKYSFYKSFYENSKADLKKVKQMSAENDKLKKQNQQLKKENFEMNYKQKKFTDEQLENLRQIPLVQVAKKLGLKETENSGSYVRFKDKDYNIVIDESKNQYADNDSLKKGFGAINFLKDFANYDFKQSIEFLSNDFSSIDIARELKSNKASDKIIHDAVVREIQELPAPVQKNIDNVAKYLTEKRCIKPELVKEMIDKNILYADKLNNCVFTNENKTYAFVRGSHPTKKFVASKGQMDFIKVSNTDEPKQVFLFESAIDMLSYRSLNPDEKGTFISIQGSAMSNRLAELSLEKYENVVCCFDNDSQGKRFDERVKEIVPTATVKKPQTKDFNDDLVKSVNEPKPNLVLSMKPTETTTIQKPKLSFGKKQTRGLTL